MNERQGHRGYIGSRPYFGDRPPQHVQNLVIRDFCSRNGFSYLLSATEYGMPGCYMILEDVIREAGRLQGIALYSLFMLPQRASRRRSVVARILDAGATLHGAVENVHVRGTDDAERLEVIWAIRLEQEKTGRPPL